MQWFRFYHEVVEDPKVQTLSPYLFRAWVNLLCIAAKHGGELPEFKAIGYRLHVTEDRAKAIVQELSQVGLFETVAGVTYPHNWNGRQFQSDVSTDRVKRHREHLRNVSSTVSGTPPDTDTESETETEQKKKESPSEIPKKTGLAEVSHEFEITAEMWAWTQDPKTSLGLTETEIRFQTAAMCDWARAKGIRRKDWIATWRNWLRNSRGGRNGRQENFESKGQRLIRQQREESERLDTLLRGTAGDGVRAGGSGGTDRPLRKGLIGSDG